MRASRRTFLRAGAAVFGTSIAGCSRSDADGQLLSEGFESESDRWTTDASIGPEEPISEFEWDIVRSEAQSAEGDWSLSIFTEGDHDDGTAWASTELSPPDDADSFSAALRAWSQSESFNTLRHLVAYLGPEPPTDEESFPEPGVNTTDVEGAQIGGLREPLHLAEGWREYTFDWQPSSVPEELFFAVGVSVVWEADATHYVDAIEITAE